MIAKLYFTYSCEYFLLVPMVLYKVNVIATTFSWNKIKNNKKKNPKHCQEVKNDCGACSYWFKHFFFKKKYWF